MRYAILLLVLAIACPLAQCAPSTPPPPTPTVSPAPTWTPAANVPNPHVEISASATTLHVGDTVTITGRQVNIGMPAFTLTLSSGAVMLVNHLNENLSGTDRNGNFEVVSMQGDLNEAVFTLRALAPGEVDVVISANGEVTMPDRSYMWGGGGSEPLHLTILCPQPECPTNTPLTPSPTLPTPIPTATITPTLAAASPDLHVELSANVTTLHVGDTITIEGAVDLVELPIYTLSLSSGGSFSAFVGEEGRTFGKDSLFELVSMRGDANRVSAELRAAAPGEADLVLSVMGEIQPEPGAYQRVFPRSAPLHLTTLE